MNKILKIISIMFLAISTTSISSATGIMRPENRVVVSNAPVYLKTFNRMKKGFMAELALLRLEPNTANWVKTARNGRLDFTESFDILGDMIAEIIACSITVKEPELDYALNMLQKPGHWNYVFLKRYLYKMVQSGDRDYADVIEEELQLRYPRHFKDISKAKHDAVAYITGVKLRDMLRKLQKLEQSKVSSIKRSSRRIPTFENPTAMHQVIDNSNLVDATIRFLSASKKLKKTLMSENLRTGSVSASLRDVFIGEAEDNTAVVESLNRLLAQQKKGKVSSLSSSDLLDTIAKRLRQINFELDYINSNINIEDLDESNLQDVKAMLMKKNINGRDYYVSVINKRGELIIEDDYGASELYDSFKNFKLDNTGWTVVAFLRR